MPLLMSTYEIFRGTNVLAFGGLPWSLILSHLFASFTHSALQWCQSSLPRFSAFHTRFVSLFRYFPLSIIVFLHLLSWVGGVSFSGRSASSRISLILSRHFLLCLPPTPALFKEVLPCSFSRGRSAVFFRLWHLPIRDARI